MTTNVRPMDALVSVGPGVLFSFVIPAREEEGYLGRSLSHLRTEVAPADLPFEIIVVDGASRDKTLAEAASADLVITGSQLACRSIAHARNVGASAATGEFLFHTDADVIVPCPTALLQQAIEEFADPAVVAIATRVMPYPWEATRRDVLLHRLGNWYIAFSYKAGQYFSRGECQIVRRTSFRAVGGYAGHFVAGEDCDLFKRLRGLFMRAASMFGRSPAW